MNSFYCDSNLKQYVSSMLFDRNSIEPIAVMHTQDIYGNSYLVTLEVRGEVRVKFKEEVYKTPLDFPDELKELIISEPANWDCHEAVYVDMNNWFEYIITKKDCVTGEEITEGIVCETDVSKMTEDDVKENMWNAIIWLNNSEKKPSAEDVSNHIKIKTPAGYLVAKVDGSYDEFPRIDVLFSSDGENFCTEDVISSVEFDTCTPENGIRTHIYSENNKIEPGYSIRYKDGVDCL